MLGLKKNCFIRGENCKPFCFSCNLSVCISQFQRLHISALCYFFGKEDHSSPKSECAQTPMGTITLTGSCLHTFAQESGLSVENIFRKDLGLSFFFFFLPQR